MRGHDFIIYPTVSKDNHMIQGDLLYAWAVRVERAEPLEMCRATDRPFRVFYHTGRVNRTQEILLTPAQVRMFKAGGTVTGIYRDGFWLAVQRNEHARSAPAMLR